MSSKEDYLCLVKLTHFHNVEWNLSRKVCLWISCQAEKFSQCWAISFMERNVLSRQYIFTMLSDILHGKYVHQYLVKLRHVHNVERKESFTESMFMNVLSNWDIFTMLSEIIQRNLLMSWQGKTFLQCWVTPARQIYECLVKPRFPHMM